MNRDAFQTSSHQKMMIGENPSLWNLSNMRPAAQPLLPSSSSSATSSSSASTSSVFPQYPQLSNLQLVTPLHDNHDQLPESWSQLLLGGLVEEEDRCSFTPFQTKKIENWELAYPPPGNMADVKREIFDQKGYLYCGGQGCEEIQAAKSPWSQILPNSSPRSCVTTSTPNSNMLDFSNCKTETKNQLLDRSSQECNSTPTGSPYKKARVQPSSAQSTFKVRKEKLGDRITALHQLVSPFGKTDTASVLLEAIGYIRFLQGQIEALSSPYLATGSAANMKQQQQQQQQPAQGERTCIFPEDPGQLLNDNCTRRRAPDQDGIIDQEPRKDLRSRGLCLVPVSFTLHVGSDNGADYWAPTFGGGFR